MRKAPAATSLLGTVLCCFCILVRSAQASGELANIYGTNTNPSFFKNSTQIGFAPGIGFTGTVRDPNRNILPSLSSVEWPEIAAIVLVVLASLLAIGRRPHVESMRWSKASVAGVHRGYSSLICPVYHKRYNSLLMIDRFR